MELPYIDRIGKNIRKIDIEEYQNFFDTVNGAKIIVFIGEGRSFSSMRVAMSRMYTNNVRVMTIYGENFPGENIPKALPRLQKMAIESKGNVVFLVNSGSGETETPKDALEDFAIASESQNIENIKIAAITGNPKSTVSKISQKFGATLNLQVEANNESNPGNVMDKGIMNDVSELGSLVILQKTKEAITRKKTASWAIREMNKEMSILERMIPDIVEQKKYKFLAEKIIMKDDVLLGALGQSKNVAEITAIRLRHIRGPMNYDTYTSGPFSSKPLPGSTALYISRNGETRPVLKWSRSNADRKVSTYCITRNGRSTLASLAQTIIVKSSEDNFYERATFALSPLPLLAIKELDVLGFKLPQEIMKWYHSSTE